MEVATLGISVVAIIVSVLSALFAYRTSQQQVAIARRTFEAQYVPKIAIRFGTSVDLTTDPPTDCFLIVAANQGHVPVLIQSVGYSIVGSQATLPLFTIEEIRAVYPPVLPAELLSGRVLQLLIPFDYLRDALRLNRIGSDDEFIVRLRQPTHQYFESDKLRVNDYLGEEPPISFRFGVEAE